MNWFEKFLCFLGIHDGDQIGTGQVIVTAKKNKDPRPIPGTWKVYKCRRCTEEYATEMKILRNP